MFCVCITLTLASIIKHPTLIVKGFVGFVVNFTAINLLERADGMIKLWYEKEKDS